MEQQTPPAGQPAPAQGGWGQPPAQPPAGWAQPQPQPSYRPSTTGLAKLGSLILILWGLLFTLLGGVTVAGGALFRDALRSMAGQDLEGGQFADALGAGLAIIGVIVLVIALAEVLVGIFSWRGSGFARVLGIIYGLLFGLTLLAGSLGAPTDGSNGGGVVGLVLAGSYLYTAFIFIVAYRSRA